MTGEVINFEALDDEAAKPGKFAAGLKFLESKLSPGDYAAYLEELGIGKDLTNKELFDKVCAKLDELMKKPAGATNETPEKPAEPEAEEEEDDEEEEKPTEAAESPEFKAFMEQCMKGGKDQKSCAEEWKKQYPSPPTGPAAKDESALAAKVEELEKKLAEMSAAKELAEITSEVNSMISAKNLAPAQRESIIKLSAKMDAPTRAEFFSVFKAQKFRVAEDAGQAKQEKPGEEGVMTPDRRKDLMAKFGIDELIADKGVRRRNN